MGCTEMTNASHIITEVSFAQVYFCHAQALVLKLISKYIFLMFEVFWWYFFKFDWKLRYLAALCWKKQITCFGVFLSTKLSIVLIALILLPGLSKQ